MPIPRRIPSSGQGIASYRSFIWRILKNCRKPPMPFAVCVSCLQFSGIRNWKTCCGKPRNGLEENIARFPKKMATGIPVSAAALATRFRECSGEVAASRPFLDFDFDIVANDTDVITVNPYRCRRAYDVTGFDVEDCAVPWAGDVAALDLAL